MATPAPSAVLALLPPDKIKGLNRRIAAIFRKKFFEVQDNWPNLAVSNSAFLLCLDSYPKGLPRQLYDDALSGQIADWDGFRSFVESLIDTVVEKSKVHCENQNKIDQISTILLELFKNTHDHARLGIDGSVIGNSIRGIYSRYYPIEIITDVLEKQKSSPEKIDALGNYINAMLKTKYKSQRGSIIDRNLSGFLELSVFDTGPWRAARWLGRDVSNCGAKEQYEAVIHCLKKGNSSSLTKGRGFGLAQVLQVLIKTKGFIRIRTNRVHVFREYAQFALHMEQQSDGHETPTEILFDWQKQYVSSLAEYLL